MYLSHITSTNRKSSHRFHVAFKFNLSVVSAAVKLPNLKAIRLKRAEIKAQQSCENLQTFVRVGGRREGGGEASLRRPSSYKRL